jgi:hypothetical protein
MVKKSTVTITCDASPLLSFVKSLKGTVNLCNLPSKLIRLEHDFSTAKAREVIVRLYPSNAFLRFAAAGIARDFNLGVIDNSSHKETSQKHESRKY